MNKIKKFKTKPVTILESGQQKLRPNIVFIWGNWVVAFLQAILFFQKPKNMPTHIQTQYNENQDISAQPGGIKLVPRKDIKSRRRAEVYKAPVELGGQDLKDFYNLCNSYLGDWYDYYIYFRWHLHVSMVYVPIFLILGWIIFKWYSLIYLIIYILGYIIIGFIIDFILKWLSKKTWHCTEFNANLYKKIGIDFGYADNEKSAPVFSYKMVKFAEWEQIST
jgi:hypothetical protein